MLRWIALASLLAALAGCGPLTQPMVERLSEEEQHHVDDIWDNMLQPPQRLERQTLLDAMVAWRMYQRGIDRLDLASEKDVLGGRVIMAVRFDRSHPSLDEFTVTYVNRHGQEVRRERYSRADVEEAGHFLFDGHACATQPVPPECQETCRLREERLARLAAASQPAWRSAELNPASVPAGKKK